MRCSWLDGVVAFTFGLGLLCAGSHRAGAKRSSRRHSPRAAHAGTLAKDGAAMCAAQDGLAAASRPSWSPSPWRRRVLGDGGSRQGNGAFSPHRLSYFQPDGFGATGWVSVGTERVRVEVEYWHQERREEYVESFELFGGVLENRSAELRVNRFYQVVVSRRFRARHRGCAAVVIGGGYGGNQGYRCHETRGVFEVPLVCRRWPAKRFGRDGGRARCLTRPRLFAARSVSRLNRGGRRRRMGLEVGTPCGDELGGCEAVVSGSDSG